MLTLIVVACAGGTETETEGGATSEAEAPAPSSLPEAEAEEGDRGAETVVEPPTVAGSVAELESSNEAESDPASEPDWSTPIVMRATDLGTGHASHTFVVERSCPLARVELDLEVESLPDGHVRLTAPSGTSTRLSLRVLTTPRFVRTWDWARLDGLHGERGRDAAGEWRLEVAASGVLYAGGRHSTPPARVPVPSFPSAELRVFCEPEVRPHDPTTGDVVRVVRDVPAAPRRSGASVRALLPVVESCTIDSLSVELHDVARYASGVRWVLVTPAGAVLRVTGWRYAGSGEERKVVATVARARGLPSAGLWELSSPRASGRSELRRAGIAMQCAP